MVFQSYALWPHMTVTQNMGYGLKLRGAGRVEIGRRIAELLATLHLEGLGERKVTALSGGSEAAAFAAIDEKIRANTRAMLKAVRDTGALPRTAALTLAKARVEKAMQTRRWEHAL
jgi:ABC-type sulfate/molybdate transport systems ATPase subunit